MNLEFSRQIFEKSLNIKFYKKLLCRGRIVPCGQTDKNRRDEGNSRSSQFCEGIKQPQQGTRASTCSKQERPVG